MPQSLSNILLHVIFSTKDRFPFLDPTIQKELYPYLATIVRSKDAPCFRVGGAEDHVHFALGLPRTLTIASLIEEIKTESSKWLKSRYPDLAQFKWQRGYAAFSVSPTHQGELEAYIEDQVEHHKKKSFQDEYRMFLKKYKLDFDERYVWD